ncbi:hypothetical protein UFOVP1033_89 [uncultured Caudovirales phage]|uniref:Uncharacterized protein n=1 Tax=uncultured Caudovirales phage TaxID=2100421 RepID=A0A6J5QA97_9CAUD|nr:hypothetical protein UFOVP1033_89 [uncultured Caudovirales phage]CAB4220859.1 hypothetical protein UFOVP1631_89 [uncultured Caudovirales phage]
MTMFNQEQGWHSEGYAKKKPYQKPYQKPENVVKGYPETKQHQKIKTEQTQFPTMKPKQWIQDELPFGDKEYPWRQTPLTDTEIEELFWGKLIQLGWKLQTYDEKNIQKKNIVLPCRECNKVLDSYSWVGITKIDAIKMSSSEQCNTLLNSHGGFVCKGIPEA